MRYLLLLSVLAVGCTTVPETGRRQFITMSPQEETALGLNSFQQIKQAKTISSNKTRQAQVSRIGRRIAHVTPMKNAHWEFVVFEDPEPNAFCLPGGKVGVQTGIFRLATTDAELAAVLAHEIAHAVARHSAEQITQNQALGAGISVLSTAASIGASVATNGSFAPGAGTVSDVLGAGATLGVVLPFSRRHEKEADELGLIYMARAGYDPRAALTFWRNMAAYSKTQGNNTPSFLSTHPMDEQRIAALEKQMPEALAEYEKTQR